MIVQPVLVVAAALFSLGIYGILVRRNAVMVLLSIELILNSVNINFIMFETINTQYYPMIDIIIFFEDIFKKF